MYVCMYVVFEISLLSLSLQKGPTPLLANSFAGLLQASISTTQTMKWLNGNTYTVIEESLGMLFTYFQM